MSEKRCLECVAIMGTGDVDICKKCYDQTQEWLHPERVLSEKLAAVTKERDEANATIRAVVGVLQGEAFTGFDPAVSVSDNVRRALVANASPELIAKEQRIAALEKALCFDEPWSIVDTLDRLVLFADYQLQANDHDGHGWEELKTCVDNGRIAIQRLSKLRTTKAALENTPKPEPRTCGNCGHIVVLSRAHR